MNISGLTPFYPTSNIDPLDESIEKYLQLDEFLNDLPQLKSIVMEADLFAFAPIDDEIREKFWNIHSLLDDIERYVGDCRKKWYKNQISNMDAAFKFCISQLKILNPSDTTKDEEWEIKKVESNENRKKELETFLFLIEDEAQRMKEKSLNKFPVYKFFEEFSENLRPLIEKLSTSDENFEILKNLFKNIPCLRNLIADYVLCNQ